jgi:hypothetical protein
MEGLIIDDAPAFDEWLMGERERWRTRMSAALLGRATQALNESRFAEASDHAWRTLAIQPFHEPAVRVVMLAAALAGDTATALGAFHDFGARLAEGIGEKPGKELSALAERIRQDSWRPARPPEAEPEPPLVGREGVHRQAFELIAAGIGGGPRLLSITGSSGMGRTRLLGECLSRLKLEGGLVAVARPLETDLDTPWSTLRLLFRNGLHQAPGLAGTTPEALGVLAGLVPELGERVAARPSRDAAQVASALAAALAAVLDERPLVLAIDDAHLADDASLAALGAAMLHLRAAPFVAIVTSAEPVSAPPRELLRLRSEAGRSFPGASLRLDPLGEDDVRRLAEALAPWCETAERAHLVDRLTVECAGNPLYLVALLRGLVRMPTFQADFLAGRGSRSVTDSLPFSLPDLLQTSIAVRAAELDETGRRVLAAASVLGSPLRPDLLAAVAELSLAEVEERLAAAERRQLLRFDGERYAFSAAIVAQAVRRHDVTPGQRVFLRRRAAEWLAGHSDLESRALRAELRATATPGAETFEEAIEVVRAALAAGGARTARRALAAGERAVRRDPNAQQRGLLDELRARIDDLTR